MSTKIVFASHHNLAKGLKDTIDYLTNAMVDIIDIPAYADDAIDTDQRIADVMGSFSKEDTVVVLVDMIGGSVCQKFYPYMNENVHIISGMSLPLALPLTLMSEGNLSRDEIVTMIAEAKEQMIYVNEHVIEVNADDE